MDLLHCRQILYYWATWDAGHNKIWFSAGLEELQPGNQFSAGTEPHSSCSWWHSGLCISLSFTHHFLSLNVSFYLCKKRELNWIIYSSSCLKTLFCMRCQPAHSNGAQSFGPMHLVQSNKPLERKWNQPFNYSAGVYLVNYSGPSAQGV